MIKNVGKIGREVIPLLVVEFLVFLLEVSRDVGSANGRVAAVKRMEFELETL